MHRLARWTLPLLAVLPVAACSAGTHSSTATTVGSVAAPTPGSTTTCRRGSAGTAAGGSGGTDVLVPGDIPDGANYVTYHGPTYHLDHPEGWAQQAGGTTVTFTDKFNSVKVDTAAAPTAPSVATARANDVAALKASVPCFEAGRVSAVSRKAGPAILVTYRADSPADPVTGKVVRQDVERYQFWQPGQQATITLSSPQGSDNVDPWRRVTDSFGWGA